MSLPDSTIAGRTGKVDGACVVVALLLLALAGVIAWNASTLTNSNPYGLGPSAMPYVVATGLCILAVGNLITGFRGGLPARESADPRPVLLILGGFITLIAIIGIGGGFILATTVLFVTTATAFGRRALLADTVIGFVTATVIFLAFDRVLSLSLPAGPIERFIIGLGRLF